MINYLKYTKLDGEFFLMADIHFFKSKRVKNMQDYTHQKKLGAWKFLLIDEKMYLISHCHEKKLL